MFGRTLLNGGNSILPTRVSADGAPVYKAGGATIAWSTVTATGTNTTTLADGSTIAASTKYLRYGQVLTKITDTNSASLGYFGPYDSSASDGRQTLSRGDCYVLDETVLQYTGGLSTLGAVNDQIGSLISAGQVWKDRIIMHAGTSGASLSAGPLISGLEPVTDFQYVTSPQ